MHQFSMFFLWQDYVNLDSMDVTDVLELIELSQDALDDVWKQTEHQPVYPESRMTHLMSVIGTSDQSNTADIVYSLSFSGIQKRVSPQLACFHTTWIHCLTNKHFVWRLPPQLRKFVPKHPIHISIRTIWLPLHSIQKICPLNSPCWGPWMDGRPT